jgi:hypothetical protein
MTTSFFKKPNSIYRDPDNGARWKAEDEAKVKAHFQAQQATVEAQIKDAVSKGINPGIKSEPGGIIPPPPNYDPYHGKVCLGPGLKRNGFGNAKVCGRQAVAVLQTAHFESEAPKAPSPELTNAALAYMAYGASAGPNPVVAASGPIKGKMIADPGTAGPGSKFVCGYHSQGLYRDALHPEDNGGKVPEAPGLGKPLMGLSHLDPRRQWRSTGSDPNFCSVTDGRVTVLASTREYVAHLAEYGSLPEFGEPLP